MPQNRWQLGVCFYGGLDFTTTPYSLTNAGTLNGKAFWTQPGGPNTQVFPTQKNNQPWPDYPIPGMIINEFIPWFSPGCLHSIKFWSIIREYDYDTQQSCALITCSICNYVQNVYEPFEEWLEPITHAIVIG